MRILIDMNLGPEWCELFARQGWEAVHWSAVGDIRAPDSEIMAWARARGYLIFTHDLDFGAILATTQANGPSLVQVRTEDVLPDRLGTLAVTVLRTYQAQLEAGAIVVLEEARARVRVLPIEKGPR